MANAGDGYIITLQKPHLEWGEYRFTGSRGIVYGEGYIPIPTGEARRLKLLNSNGAHNRDVWGENLFNCSSADGEFRCVLRAQGCSRAGEPFAKQFAGDNNLKALGDWYYHIGAKEGDRLKITWTSPKDIVIELI